MYGFRTAFPPENVALEHETFCEVLKYNWISSKEHIDEKLLCDLMLFCRTYELLDIHGWYGEHRVSLICEPSRLWLADMLDGESTKMLMGVLAFGMRVEMRF